MFKPNSGEKSAVNSEKKKGLHPPTVSKPTGPSFFISKLGPAKYDETGRMYFEKDSDKLVLKSSSP